MIRKAKSTDIALINQLGTLINPDFIKVFNMADIINEPVSLVFIYELDGHVVAFLHVTKLYEIVDIINICVDPMYRNRNIASCLIDELITGLTKETKLITLEVAINNVPAIKLYEKFGFKKINTRKNYYHYDTDAYVMGLEINYE